MAAINLTNGAGLDAIVVAESVGSRQTVRWVDDRDRQASSVRVLKSPIDHDIAAMGQEFGDDLNAVATALVDGDPEIDLEKTGRFLRETSRVYIDPDRKVVHRVQLFERVLNPDGSEREYRPLKITLPNLAGTLPLKWSGRFIPKADAVRKFVFSGKYQITHINGLTYEFLFGMAETLHEKNSLMMLGAGPKSNEPLVLQRGGTPYRGFLEGRVDGDKYCLILHFSNLELKVPATAEGEES